MNGLRHPFSGALYESDGEGTVTVTLGDERGRFTAEGRWIDGVLREADPHLCGWVAGKRMVSRRTPAPDEAAEDAANSTMGGSSWS